MAKEKKPIWFKVYNSLKGVVEGVEDDRQVGKAFRVALNYSTGEEVNDEDLSDLPVKIIFHALKQGIDESRSDLKSEVASGTVGGLTRTANALKKDIEDLSRYEVNAEIVRSKQSSLDSTLARLRELGADTSEWEEPP